MGELGKVEGDLTRFNYTLDENLEEFFKETSKL